MRDEKRQTRLLPFRLRREGPARDARSDEDARDFMEPGAREGVSSQDSELGALLQAWEAPAPSADSRERLLTEFRTSVRRAPLWRRALSAELRVPLPAAACAAVALLASLFALAARATNNAEPTRPSQVLSAAEREGSSRSEPALKIVEVPVERERVVTRYVYIEHGARAAEARQLAEAQQSTTARGGETTRAAQVASESRGPRPLTGSGAQATSEPASYYTRVDMADFEPDDMKIRIVSRGKTNEK
jgi:hypothetical protein